MSICSKVRHAATLVILATVMVTSSCSHQKTLSVEDLRSTLTQVISLASESETFINYVAQRRSTNDYAKVHLQYLLEEASRSAKELRESAPEPKIQPVVPECQNQIDSLVHSLAFAHQEFDHPERLERVEQQVNRVRQVLEGVRGSL